MDETGLTEVHTPPNIIAAKGKKGVHSITSGEKGTTTTIVSCCNASGRYVPPLIIFKGIRENPLLIRSAPAGTIVKLSKTGWITSDIFYEWMKHFNVHRQKTPDGATLLILDGHISHLAIDTLKYAEQNKIVMVCLPSHCTHHLQPLDKSVFKSLKAAWNEVCAKYMRDNRGKNINRYVFCELFNSAYSKSATHQNASSGFLATGIWPLNRNAIPAEAYAPSETTNRSLQLVTLIENENSISRPTALSVMTSDRPNPTQPQLAAVEMTSPAIQDLHTGQSLTETEPATTSTVQRHHPHGAASDASGPDTFISSESDEIWIQSVCTTELDVTSIRNDSPSFEQSVELSELSTHSLSPLPLLPPTPDNPTSVTNREHSYVKPVTSFQDLLPVPAAGISSGVRRKRPLSNLTMGVVNSPRKIDQISNANEIKLALSLQKGKRKKTGADTVPKKSKPGPNKKPNATVKKSKPAAAAGQSKNDSKQLASKTSLSKSNAGIGLQLDDTDNRRTNQDNYCGHCQGYYYDDTSDDEDWMNCVQCHKWFHDSCSGSYVSNAYNSYCSNCRPIGLRRA